MLKKIETGQTFDLTKILVFQKRMVQNRILFLFYEREQRLTSFKYSFKRSVKIKHTIVIVKVAREGGSFIINRNKNNKSRVIYGETFRTFHRNFPHPSNHHFCTTDLKLTRKNQKNTAGNINICQSSYLTILIIHIYEMTKKIKYER